MKKILSSIIISCGFIYGQSFGIGMELSDLMTPKSESLLNIPTILLPITIGSILRIEPEIYLERKSTKIAETDGQDGTTLEYFQDFTLGLLVFLSHEEGENNFYIGVR